MLHPNRTLNCNRQLLALETPIVMGILNVTPDSFYDGGQLKNVDAVLHQAEQMLVEGASILDIGGMSSRPGAKVITVEEELRRVIEPIAAIHQRFPEAILSIDTVQARVAQAAVEAGASVVNDISAGRLDTQMYPTVADLQVPYVLMHMQGRPETMQQSPSYNDPIEEVLDFFIQEVEKLKALGVKDIVLDAGFGFGKRLEDNYLLLKKMHVFQILDCPVLAGLSRKSMIYKHLDLTPDTALNGTTALHMVALQQGARILRVHDVAEAVQCVRLWELLEKVHN
jgi:dihydropteroate synthase